MKTRSLTNSLKLVTLASLLAFGAAAHAAPGDMRGDTAAGCEHQAGKHAKYGAKHAEKQWRNAGLVVPGYGPVPQAVVDSLALTDAQKALVDAAKQEQKLVREKHREQMKSAFASRAEGVTAGKIDPQAVVVSMQQSREAMQESRSDIQKKWLAVWDALDAGQQGKITAHFQERAEKYREHQRRHAERSAS